MADAREAPPAGRPSKITTPPSDAIAPERTGDDRQPAPMTKAEVVDILDPTTAQTLVERIDEQTATVNTEAGALIELCAEALRGKAWIGAGFGSWVELCEARGWEFNPRTSTDRAALAKVMRESGMSFRAIGKLVGASAATIHADTSGVQNRTPDDTVTGADGKQYPSRRTVAAAAEGIGGDDLADGEAEAIADTLDADIRRRVDAGRISIAKAQQLSREREDRISSMVTALTGLIEARHTVANFEAQVDAARHSPEYPRALARLDDDVREAVVREFPHVT